MYKGKDDATATLTDTFTVPPALSRMSMLVVPADTPVTM